MNLSEGASHFGIEQTIARPVVWHELDCEYHFGRMWGACISTPPSHYPFKDNRLMATGPPNDLGIIDQYLGRYTLQFLHLIGSFEDTVNDRFWLEPA